MKPKPILGLTLGLNVVLRIMPYATIQAHNHHYRG